MVSMAMLTARLCQAQHFSDVHLRDGQRYHCHGVLFYYTIIIASGLNLDSGLKFHFKGLGTLLSNGW